MGLTETRRAHSDKNVNFISNASNQSVHHHPSIHPPTENPHTALQSRNAPTRWRPGKWRVVVTPVIFSALCETPASSFVSASDVVCCTILYNVAGALQTCDDSAINVNTHHSLTTHLLVQRCDATSTTTSTTSGASHHRVFYPCIDLSTRARWLKACAPIL